MEEEETGSNNLKPLLSAPPQSTPILTLADLYDSHIDISTQSQRHFWFYFLTYLVIATAIHVLFRQSGINYRWVQLPMLLPEGAWLLMACYFRLCFGDPYCSRESLQLCTFSLRTIISYSIFLPFLWVLISLRDILIFKLWFLSIVSLLAMLLCFRCVLRVHNHLMLFRQHLQKMRSNGLYIVEPIVFETVEEPMERRPHSLHSTPSSQQSIASGREETSSFRKFCKPHKNSIYEEENLSNQVYSR